MKKTTALVVTLAMVATSFAQGPKQDKQGERPGPPPLPSLEEVFEKWDKNKDGVLSKEEFDALRQENVKQRQGRKQRENKNKNTILPPEPPNKPVIVPSQRFIMPKYS